MSFETLLDNLIVVVRDRINNGEITERRLAKVIGISQPHIHNVLKGVRPLTPELSDRLLRGIKLTVNDLLEEERADSGIPMIAGLIGPGYPYPRERYIGLHPFLPELTQNLVHPAVYRLARDPEMLPDLVERDFVLVDRSRVARCTPDERSLYLVALDGCAMVRYVRRSGSRLSLAACADKDRPDVWRSTSLVEQDILEVIRGRIVWIGRQMETPAGPVDEAGPGTRSPSGAG